jgi:hypothetical protein
MTKELITCKFCKFFQNYVPSKEYPDKGFGECGNPKVESSAFYNKDGTKLKFYVSNTFGCIFFERRCTGT